MTDSENIQQHESARKGRFVLRRRRPWLPSHLAFDPPPDNCAVCGQEISGSWANYCAGTCTPYLCALCRRAAPKVSLGGGELDGFMTSDAIHLWPAFDAAKGALGLLEQEVKTRAGQ